MSAAARLSATVSPDLSRLEAGELVAWAYENHGERLAMSTSFGADSAVLLHLVTRYVPDVQIIFVDTGYHFPETYQHAEQLTSLLSLNVYTVTPRMSAARQEALFGRLWNGDESELRRYQNMNKVEPMHRALRELDITAWMSGVRRDQTATRNTLPRAEQQDGVLKLHPLLDWTQQDVEAYMREHELPYHPLVAQGYRSIGDVHSTIPTLPDQHPRAGRLLGEKKECGLHLRRQ